jgi:predicted nucleotidyltransferase
MLAAMIEATSLFGANGGSDALQSACRRFGVRQLDLFGSAATGRGFDPARSDIDLLVAFEPRPPADYADAYFGLREALESLSGRPIDLLTEAALENPHLRRRVETERRALYRAP